MIQSERQKPCKRNMNIWQAHTRTEERSSCLDLLQYHQSNIGGLAMTSVSYHDVMMSLRQSVMCVCAFLRLEGNSGCAYMHVNVACLLLINN